MLPSTDDIAKFISIAPEATEGKALIFLQVYNTSSRKLVMVLTLHTKGSELFR